MNGCGNCRNCKVYRGSYWDPDDHECVGTSEAFNYMSQDEIDAISDRVWVNGEEWTDDEEPICPAWEEVNYDPEEEYWDRYAWEEKNYDKDEAE